MRMSQIRYEMDRLADMIMYLQLEQDENKDFYSQVKNIRKEIEKVEEAIGSLKLETKHLEDKSL